MKVSEAKTILKKSLKISDIYKTKKESKAISKKNYIFLLDAIKKIPIANKKLINFESLIYKLSNGEKLIITGPGEDRNNIYDFIPSSKILKKNYSLIDIWKIFGNNYIKKETRQILISLIVNLAFKTKHNLNKKENIVIKTKKNNICFKLYKIKFSKKEIEALNILFSNKGEFVSFVDFLYYVDLIALAEDCKYHSTARKRNFKKKRLIHESDDCGLRNYYFTIISVINSYVEFNNNTSNFFDLLNKFNHGVAPMSLSKTLELTSEIIKKS